MNADMEIVKAITERLNRHGYKRFRVIVHKYRSGQMLIDIIHHGSIPSYVIRLIENDYRMKQISFADIAISKDAFDEPTASGAESGRENG